MEILDLKLSVVYKVLKKLSERGELLISEVIALTGSSTFHQKYLPYLEKRGYIESEKKIIHGRKIRTLKLTDKGRNLLSLLEEIKKLDSMNNT